jgi:hypothetical protein
MAVDSFPVRINGYERGVHALLSDTLIQYPGPTKIIDGTVLDAAAGATGVVRFFDANKTARVQRARTYLLQDEPAAETSIRIPNWSEAWISAGDTVEIDLDNGRTHSSTVASYTPDASGHYDTIVLDTGLATAASTGKYLYLTALGGTIVNLPVEFDASELEIGDVGQFETTTPATFYYQTVADVITSTAQHLRTGETDPKPSIDSPPVVVLRTAGAANDVSAGASVRGRVIVEKALAQYGTSSAGSDSWGFSVTIADDDANLEVGMTILAEIHFNGGAGFQDVQSIHIPVVR